MTSSVKNALDAATNIKGQATNIEDEDSLLQYRNSATYEVPRDSIAVLRKGSNYADLLINKNSDPMGNDDRLWSMAYLKVIS